MGLAEERHPAGTGNSLRHWEGVRVYFTIDICVKGKKGSVFAELSAICGFVFSTYRKKVHWALSDITMSPTPSSDVWA